MPVDFGAAFNALPDAYLLLSADGEFTVLGASDFQLQVTRGRREDVIGRRLFDLLPSDPDGPLAEGIQNLRASLEKVLATKERDVLPVQPYFIRDPDRHGIVEERHGILINVPAIGPDGEVSYIIHKVQDRTEVIRQQRENDTRLRLATRTADLGSWEYEPSTDLFDRSAFIDELFGFASGEAGPHAAPFFARVHPDDLETARANLQSVAENPDLNGARFDLRIVLPDGRIRWVIARGEVMQDRVGQPTRLIGVAVDSTADRERERALEVALAEREVWLRQKDLLFREVNHRVKNSLQLVMSILNLQANDTQNDAARSHLLSAGSRIAAIMGVHERLYQSENVTTIEMDKYLRRLCSDITASTNGGAGDCWIDMEADPVELPIELAVPIALIVNELVTNAVKHAYPEGGGPVRLELREETDGSIRLLVADKGIGFGQEAGRKGLGSRLIPGLARQLRGQLDFKNLEPGYQVVLKIPPARSPY
ncbi:MAG TPA: histidine kinase dimerization/phosphoacceptor domain -containing protein [Parvibaculum sp.]|jgi:two-component sensor histidine kinase